MLNRGMRESLRVLVLAYPARSAIILVLLILSGLAEGLGLTALLPLLSIAGGGGTGSETLIGRAVHAGFSRVGLEPTLGYLLGLIVVVMSAKAMLLFAAMVAVGYTSARVVADLRLAVIRSILRTRWDYLISRPAGSFVNAITSEALRTSGAYNKACTLLADAIQVLAYSTVACLVSWKVMAIGFVVGGVMMLMVRSLVTMATRAGQALTDLMKSVSGRLADSLQGIKPIKAMACEDLVTPLLESETRELERSDQRFALSRTGLVAIQEPIMVGALALGVYGASTYWGLNIEILLVMGVLFWRTVSRIASVQRSYQELTNYESGFWSIRTTIDEAQSASEVESGAAEPRFSRDITLNNVSLSYGEKQVLRCAAATFPAGSFIALTGPSGSGKTSIADLIVGLVKPQSGEVLIDDVPLDMVDLKAWRSLVGYVPQETFLFHDSVLRNVTLGDESITRAEVQSALEAAGAWEFVRGLPDGMDSIAGERGSKLSGGQRQRIAIARALVRKPVLLILDEVTASLDPETETEVCATLKSLKGSATILAISHQPSLVQEADIVYEVASGDCRKRPPFLVLPRREELSI